MMRNKIEVLSPAKNMDTVIAAVRSGADAVYVGGKNFSARMSADNFTIEELGECIRYCHIHDVKVYVTVNTLILDEELEEALSFVRQIALLDVDAVIVQDIGLAYAIHKMIPDLRLHASTQMSIHTLKGVQALEKLGFRRVVLARELDRNEIREIHDQCPEMELEVFVHGALCMCTSGQCYFSSMLGGRSANRGMCAQTCRLPFSVGSKGDHVLSLKDNSIIDYLDDLYEIGVTSAKIEGRMKRPEYVSAATKACREKIDSGYISENTKEELDAVFSRTGFTDGYYTGHTGHDMFGYRQKEDVVSATGELFRKIQSGYSKEKQYIPLKFEFYARIGEYPTLSCEDICVRGESIAEKAVKISLDREKIEKNLKKTGGTPYYVETVSVDIEENISIPLSVINSMRRTLIEKINKKREKCNTYREVLSVGETMELLDKSEQTDRSGHTKRYAVCADTGIPHEFRDLDIVFIDLFSLSDDKKVKELISSGINTGADIPRVMFSKENSIIKRLKELKTLGINDVMCHNLASLFFAKEMGFSVHGSFSLNVFNSFSILFLKEYGITDIEVSMELSLSQYRGLKRFIPAGFAVYGYMPVMITRNCPGKSIGSDCKSCKKDLFLQDRYNKRFFVRCGGYYCEILNSVPLILSQKIYNGAEPDLTVFHFYVENSVEKVKKIASKNNEKPDFNNFTKGLSAKGVKKLTYF